MKDKQHAEAFWNHVSLAKEDALPLGERVAALHHNSRIRNDVKLGHGGTASKEKRDPITRVEA